MDKFLNNFEKLSKITALKPFSCTVGGCPGGHTGIAQGVTQGSPGVARGGEAQEVVWGEYGG